MCLGLCQEENGGIFGKNHFGPWDACIFEVEPALHPIGPNFVPHSQCSWLCHEPAVAVDLGVLVQVVAVLADALQLCEDALPINRERKKAVKTPIKICDAPPVTS